MILVTLGTQDKEFTRLLKEIDKLISKKIIKDEVIVQAGYTKYESKNMKVFDYVDSDVFNNYVEKANLIICHAGVGTIFDCIKKNKKVIVVPRLAKFNEHNNDHQLEITKEFEKKGYVLSVYDIKDLEKVIDKSKKFKPNKFVSNNKNMVKLIGGYIDSNRRSSMLDLLKKYKEIIMYLIFGVLTTVVSVATRIILFHTILSENSPLQVQIATIISNAVGIIFAYFTNRKFVFESKNKNKFKEFVSFVTGRISTLLMDMLIMFVGVTLLKGNSTVITLISQVLVIVANYLISKLIVFKKKEK